MKNKPNNTLYEKGIKIIEIIYYKLIGQGDLVKRYETEDINSRYKETIAKLEEITSKKNIESYLSNLKTDLSVDDVEKKIMNEDEENIPDYFEMVFSNKTDPNQIEEILKKVKTSYEYGVNFLGAFCIRYDLAPELTPELPALEKTSERVKKSLGIKTNGTINAIKQKVQELLDKYIKYIDNIILNTNGIRALAATADYPIDYGFVDVTIKDQPNDHFIISFQEPDENELIMYVTSECEISGRNAKILLLDLEEGKEKELCDLVNVPARMETAFRINKDYHIKPYELTDPDKYKIIIIFSKE